MAWGLVLAAITGCGGEAAAPTINGRVTYQERPIDSGSLTFFPEVGRPVTAIVTGGDYTCQLPPGVYRVVVTVGVSLPEGWKEGDPVPPQPVALPSEYNTRMRTPLTATVAADHSGPIDFALK